MTGDGSRFRVTRNGARVEVAFDDGGMNLLSTAALRELREIVAHLSQLGEPPRVLSFRSARPNVFAAGADMAEMERFGPLQAEAFSRLGQETFAAIERLPMITVAAIDGDCFGGALDLVLAFDLRFASARSRFSHPGAKLGIVTGFGGTARWRRVMGRPAAQALFLANPLLDADAALALGLLDGIGEVDYEMLASRDPASVRMLKELGEHGPRVGQRELVRLAELLARVYG